MTCEFSASSWQTAATDTQTVSQTLLPKLERATTGTPLGAASQSPVDRAAFDGFHDRNQELFRVQEAIRQRLASEASKMTQTGQDYHATEQAACQAAEQIW